MKIKYWLMISYLLVMVLPIAALYILYISLNSYDQEEDIKEYFEFQLLVANLDSELQDVSLYKIQPEENYQHLGEVTDDNLKIDLYRYDGVQLYTTINTPGSSPFFQMNQEKLFQNLNEYQKNPRTYSVKKLVFDDTNQLAGLYEITLGRKEWVETSNERTIVMFVLLGIFFVSLYSVVIFSLNRKLNRPLSELQDHMKAFAAGENPEHQLVQSKDEIGVLITHFEQMKAQIVETRNALAREEKEKEYMVASLSHDLKTPLTVIRTYTEALESHNLSKEERKEYQTILQDKLEHMKHMIDDLSIFTALQSVENRPAMVQVNGNEFFEMLFSGYEEPCSKKNIELKTELYVRNSYKLDPKQMVRLVDNLMDNSIRYTPEHHHIWLAAISSRKSLPDWVFPEFTTELNLWRENGTVILIQNEGKGMGQTNLERVFQPFYQDDVSRGKGSTSGLGLSIAKIIMEKHGGKITIWSTENKGALIACWIKERGSS
ncbi:ATP-binding protein [Oceanobacillus sp. FSL H7-0719]|uniref:HAMP domain-containing sensor histidine kinase n=1 Tax=Oceanobacillus sp. FSL H7-0719 TaxID=2954507 RepID=UPI0032441D13